MRAVMSSITNDLLAWRTQTGVDRFDEMWEGVLHMNAAPHGDHQLLQDDLREWLKRCWARPRKARAVCQRNVAKPNEWPRNYRIPDIVLLTPDRQQFEFGDYIGGPPLVAVEIRSPGDESYEKLPFYAELGVPEVWIIDRDSRTVEIFQLCESRYCTVAADGHDWATSPATEVRMRITDNGLLAVQIVSDPQTYCELPED